jgi:hypothetical protein
MTVIIERISWLTNVTDNNDARWKPEINRVGSLYYLLKHVIPTSEHYSEVPLLLGLYRNYKSTNKRQ